MTSSALTPSLSVTAPLTPAIERVKDVLFRPFDLGRWLTIGFCAWLAFLGQSGGGGGGGGNYNFGGGQHGPQNLSRGLRQAWDYLLDNLYWIIPVAIAGILLILAFSALLTWLSSRGQFMFLHCVATNRAQVSESWRQHGRQANSLFVFRFVLSLIGFVLIFPTVVLAVGMVLAMIADERFSPGLALGAAAGTLAAMAFGTILAVIGKLTLDFVTPIMRLRPQSCRSAWKEFFVLLSAWKGAFLLYLLFQIALEIVAAVIVLALVIITCCCAGCLLAIPFVGTVLYLPVLVFDRAYSLYYLEQFGPEYRVIESNVSPTQITPSA